MVKNWSEINISVEPRCLNMNENILTNVHSFKI